MRQRQQLGDKKSQIITQLVVCCDNLRQEDLDIVTDPQDILYLRAGRMESKRQFKTRGRRNSTPRTKKPNFHTAIHYSTMADEYSIPSNGQVLIGEDKQ